MRHSAAAVAAGEARRRPDAILASAPDCPGDGNIDSVVNQQDVDDWRFYSQSYGLSTVYDLNLDGITDAGDEAIIEQNVGVVCANGQTATAGFRAALYKGR
ncbi:MAG: hypothetical protein ABI629_11045 [bacterium]